MMALILFDEGSDSGHVIMDSRYLHTSPAHSLPKWCEEESIRRLKTYNIKNTLAETFLIILRT